MAPFEGLKVIECATYIAGPCAASVLAEFGAEVVKIEPPGGDPYRNRSIPPGSGYVHPRNPGFMLDGRSRRSIVLDLSRPEGQAVLRRLAATADVFITNAPPDVRRKLGVTYEALAPLNPRLIHASLTGYGDSGPDATRPGFDVTAWWARSGLMHLVRAEDAVPARSLGGMGDHPSGMALYAAIATALYERERTGRGMEVGSSLLANGLWANAAQVQARLLGEEVKPQPRRDASGHPLRNHYRCKDGKWLILSIVADQKRWEAFRRATGSSLLDDPRFATVALRNENGRALTGALDAMFATRSRAEWVAMLEPSGIVFGIVAEMEDIPDAQMVESGALVPFADDDLLTISTPFWVGGAPKRAPTHAPEMGADNEAVLREAGFAAGEIAALTESGVVGGRR